MQDANANCQSRELVEEPLRVDLDFTFPLQHVFELFVLGERMSSIAFDKFGLVGKNLQNGSCFSPTISQSHPTTQIWTPRLISL